MLHSSLLTPAIYACAVAVLTLVGGIAYRRVWQARRSDGATPTGYGLFLAPVMLIAGLLTDASSALVVSLAVVTAATVVFWIDDLMQLSARLRIAVSFLAGIAIGAAYWGVEPAVWPILLLAGFVSVVLTNMVNFYDGADLNLTSFIALTASMILLFTVVRSEWVPVALSMLGFILPFGVMNSRPRTIYLGDAGSFAFAGLLTIMAIAFARDITVVAPEAAIPAALPTLDVAYVFAVRLIEKHDMLTRNYLHLYQRLNRRYQGFGYLVPQFVNAGLGLSCAALMQFLGSPRILAVILAMIAISFPFYFLCRRVFLAGPPEGPLYETSR